MNRVHNGKQAVQAVIWAQELFDNISIDLLFGTPHTTFADWQENLEIALKLDVSHISSYALTLEPKTSSSTWGLRGIIGNINL